MKKDVLRMFAASLAVVALTSAAVSPAQAAPDGTDSTARLISNLAPPAGKVSVGKPSSGNFEFLTRGTKLSIPQNPSLPIVASGFKENFSVGLPKELALKGGRTAADGTVVFDSKNGGSSAAVQVLTSGDVRVHTVIPNRAALTPFTYSFPSGSQPILLEDGSVLVSNPKMESFSHIASPWAVDSKGTKVATHYVVKGALLVQVVEPTKSSAYPILADPTWTWYTAAYGVKFNRSETRTLAVSGGVTGMCVYLKKAASSVAAKICAFAGAYLFAQASIAEGAKPKECIFVSVVPAPLVWRLKC